jgi:hypothetical protein
MKSRQFKRNRNPRKITPFSGMEELLRAYAVSREIDSTVALLMKERGWDQETILKAQQDGHLYNPDRDSVLALPEWSPGSETESFPVQHHWSDKLS